MEGPPPATDLPFGWLDNPPSANRLLGLLWLPRLFGARPREDLEGQASAVSQLLYHQ